MGALVQLHPERYLPAVQVVNAWEAATEAARLTAQMRLALLAPAQAWQVSLNEDAKRLYWGMRAGRLPMQAQQAAKLLCEAEDVSWQTLKRWLEAYRKHGKTGLLPRHTGRVRVPQAWDARAVYLWASPESRGYADIAFKLRGEGFDVQAKRLRDYIQSLPAALANKQSAQRVGPHFYKLNYKHHQRRHVDDLLAGEMYAADGHTIDCYLAHPATGGIYRPELTLFMDIKSRYIVGWWLSDSETKESTLFALSHALRMHDHVPAWVYTDHGAGYRAKMLSADNTGFFIRFGIETIAALPGNANGKGWIERFFRTVRDKHDKFFKSELQVYCGDDMAAETNRRISVDVKPGKTGKPKRELPSLEQYRFSLEQFIEQYHHEPMPVALKGQTPAQVWSALQRNPVHTDMDAVMRPQIERTVSQQEVTLHKRIYHAEPLVNWDGKKVLVEYDLHSDAMVWVRKPNGGLICTAPLVHTMGVLPTDRLQEQRELSAKAAAQRQLKHAQEKLARGHTPIDAHTQFEALVQVTAGAALQISLPAPRPQVSRKPTPAPQADVTDIDLLNWRKD